MKKAEIEKYELFKNKREKTSEHWKMICVLTDKELVRFLSLNQIKK